MPILKWVSFCCPGMDVADFAYHQAFHCRLLGLLPGENTVRLLCLKIIINTFYKGILLKVLLSSKTGEVCAIKCDALASP